MKIPKPTSPSGSTAPAVLRKKSSTSPAETQVLDKDIGKVHGGKGFWDQIGRVDHQGWLRKKGERYSTWTPRYLVLKGSDLYYLRSDSKTETKIKGYIDIKGYKVLADENVNPGRYGFRIIHDVEKAHYFSSEESFVVREWMKALMKATIGRDYSKPVVSSVNIPTIPLTVAQAMNPAPRPPSPSARHATQKAMRRENPHELSTRDAQVLMGMSSTSGSPTNYMEGEDGGYDITTPPAYAQTPRTPQPPRPARKGSVVDSSTSPPQNASPRTQFSADPDLLRWANEHLSHELALGQTTSYALSLFRLTEKIKGRPCDPPVPDSVFPTGPSDDKLDGLFQLFDLLLEEGVKMGNVSINDVRQGKEDKIVQILKALKSWEDKRKGIRQGSSANPFLR